MPILWNPDVQILFVTRMLRLFSYGCISVIFLQHLFIKNLTKEQISHLQIFIILGQIIITIFLSTQADKIGRKKTLMIGAMFKFLSGIFYAYSLNVTVLIVSGILGVISVSGGQVGPFIPIEQSSITQIIQDTSKTQKQVSERVSRVFGYYNLAGYVPQAAGAVFSGYYIKFMTEKSFTEGEAMTQIMLLYGLFGLTKAILYFMLSSKVEAKVILAKEAINFTGIKKQNIWKIVKLSLLFAVDSYAGGFVMQSFLSFFFEARFNMHFKSIGYLLSICNIVSGISGIVSAKLVSKYGAMATMIYTHLPSNIFLLFIPFCTNYNFAMFWLILRFCISQMDTPARQTYVTMVVSSSERSSANGITNIARAIGFTASFPLSSYLLQMNPTSFAFTLPFLIAGIIKIMYDFGLIFCFLNEKKNGIFEMSNSEQKNLINVQQNDLLLDLEKQKSTSPQNEPQDQDWQN